MISKTISALCFLGSVGSFLTASFIEQSTIAIGVGIVLALFGLIALAPGKIANWLIDALVNNI